MLKIRFPHTVAEGHRILALYEGVGGHLILLLTPDKSLPE